MSKIQTFELWNLSAAPVLADPQQLTAKCDMKAGGEVRESTVPLQGTRGIQTPDSRGGAQDICGNRHKGNPESQKAFQSVKDGLSEQQQRVLKAIRDSDNGLTVDEIATKLGVTPNMVSGRASELKRDGKIYKAGTRLTRSGCQAAILKVAQ